jgi:hypothetical protein
MNYETTSSLKRLYAMNSREYKAVNSHTSHRWHSSGAGAAGQGSSQRDNRIMPDSANQPCALQAKFYDAIFSPESRVPWLIRDEGTVAAVLRNH